MHSHSNTPESDKHGLIQLINDNWGMIEQFKADYKKATVERDREAIEYLDLAIQFIRSGSNTRYVSLDEWRQNALEDPRMVKLDQQDRDAENWFFDRFAQLKCELGLSTRKLAEAAKLNKNTITAIEQRRVKPHMETVKQLADAFGVAVEDMLPPRSMKGVSTPPGPNPDIS